MSDTARAFWSSGAGSGELLREPLPPLRDGEVEVHTLASGISRGTESLVFRGRVPRSEHARMRAPHQTGDFPGPVKYGYSAVGRVVAGDERWLGRVVFCLHPHQDRFRVPVSALRQVPVGVPPERAVLAANVETALNATWDAPPRIGDRIAVVGAGSIGCLVAHLCARVPECRVEVIEPRADRAGVLAELGLDHRAPGAGTPNADIVYHCSGTSAGLAEALALAGDEADVLELSWYGASEVSVPLGAAFHSRRLSLRSSQVGAIAPARRRRRSHEDRARTALRLLTDAKLDALLDGPHAFEDLPSVMARVAERAPARPMPVIRYSAPSGAAGDSSVSTGSP